MVSFILSVINCIYEIIVALVGPHVTLISHFGFFSVISRVQKTLHGSSDDIGWLQCTPGVAPVEDGTARFLEVLQGIRWQFNSYPFSHILNSTMEFYFVGYGDDRVFISLTPLLLAEFIKLSLK